MFIYLDDNEAGHTLMRTFGENIAIPCRKGSVLFFPPFWPWLHAGRKPVDKYPYCELHMLYSFSKKDEKEEDQITEEDIPKFIEKKIKLA